MISKKNNFDLLRLVFAFVVCLVHICDLSGMGQLSWIAYYLSSAVAVKSFFVVSGFLIFMSYDRSSSLRSYCNKRLRRIYPAYLTVILLCSFGLYFITQAGLSDYFSYSWFKYLIVNSVFFNFLQPDIPLVFESNRYSAINGALWTLKIEMMFYVSVPILAYFFRKYSTLVVILIVYLGSIVYNELLLHLMVKYSQPLFGMFAKQLPGQLSYFMAGAFFYYYFEFYQKHAKIMFIGAVLVLLFRESLSLHILEPVALATVVIFVAFFKYFGKFGKYGDFSYGLYIAHFPIIQIFVHFGWLQQSPRMFLITAALVCLLAGILMWHVVEKRFLLSSSHYRSLANRVSSVSG